MWSVFFSVVDSALVEVDTQVDLWGFFRTEAMMSWVTCVPGCPGSPPGPPELNLVSRVYLVKPTSVYSVIHPMQSVVCLFSFYRKHNETE